MFRASQQLRIKADECNMSYPRAFVGKLEEVRLWLRSDPVGDVEQTVLKLKFLRRQIEKTLAEPNSIRPDDQWYSSSVCTKLEAMKTGLDVQIDSLTEQLKVFEPMITSAKRQFEKAGWYLDGLQKLVKLPELVHEWYLSVNSEEDLAKLDRKAIKGCLEIKGMPEALQKLSKFTPAWSATTSEVRFAILQSCNFVRFLPQSVHSAFVPSSGDCGCMAGLFPTPVPESAQSIMQDMRKIAEDMSVSLLPVVKGLDAFEVFCNLKPDEVTVPVEAYAKKMARPVHYLEVVLGVRGDGCFAMAA